MVFFCEMAILVVFNSFKVVQNLKKPDPVARQMPPFNTTYSILGFINDVQSLLTTISVNFILSLRNLKF